MGLLDGAVTRTEIAPVVMAGDDKLLDEVRTLLRATTASEVHLAFTPRGSDDQRRDGSGDWQVHGMLITHPDPPPVVAVVDDPDADA